MLIKKIAALGTALLMLPIAAQAGLFTQNNTHEDSAVILTTGNFKNKCTGTLPYPLTSFTPAGGSSDIPWPVVNTLCAGSGDACKATVYMSKDCKNGTNMALATLKNNSVTVVRDPDPNGMGNKYKATASGSNMTVDYNK